MQPTADYWIQKLGMAGHTEGGCFRRFYASNIRIPQAQLPDTFHGSRPTSTAIYFMLQKGEISALHRIASDEIWHFYYGDPLEIYQIDSQGRLSRQMLGNNPANDENFQCVVKAGNWFGSKVKEGGSYALTGCTVSPGFDFEDFELARRGALVKQYPQHEAIIRMLTHPE